MFPKQLPSLGRCSFVSQYQPSRSLITTTQLTRTAVLDCVNTPAAPSASTVNNSIDIRRKEGEHDEVNMMMAGKVEVESSARLFNNNFEEEGNDINIDNDHHHIASSSPFVAVRSSPQAKFGKARIGMTTFPAELSSVIASIAKGNS